MTFAQAANAFFNIGLNAGDMCVCTTDEWTGLEDFRTRRVGDVIEIGPLLDISDRQPGRTFSGEERENVRPSPYAIRFRARHLEIAMLAWLIRDLASSNLRGASIEVDPLIDRIASDSRLVSLDRRFIELCLKCSVATGAFIVKVDHRTRERIPKLEISPIQRDVEKRRAFAGTFAEELSSQSDRIRQLIRHSSSVGTYRENLLQSLLRRHLPDRYHVATGFIFGCDRQIDIVIYDRIDYAPIFREGDLVVVPPESVRAVVEVKTDLTKELLRECLSQIEEISFFDDLDPPFFKGIFSFETRVDSGDLLNEIIDFHTEEVDEISDEPGFEETLPHLINEPYHHLTSLCVLGAVYGQVIYEINETNDSFRPALMSKDSATGLRAQASHFLEAMLSYLRYGGLKSADVAITSRMLGADTQMQYVGPLTLDSWGGFFARDEGMDGGEVEAERTKTIIVATENWKNGAEWVSPALLS